MVGDTELKNIKSFILGPKKAPAGIWLAIQSFWVVSMCPKIDVYISENNNPSKFRNSEKRQPRKQLNSWVLKRFWT